MLTYDSEGLNCHSSFRSDVLLDCLTKSLLTNVLLLGLFLTPVIMQVSYQNQYVYYLQAVMAGHQAAAGTLEAALGSWSDQTVCMPDGAGLC